MYRASFSRPLFGLNRTNCISKRRYATPLLKQYSPFKTPLSLLWATKVPAIAKAFSGVVALAMSLTNIHPDVLITAGPPLLGAGYIAYRKHEKRKYLRALELVLKLRANALESDIIEVARYDETDLDLALKGIDSEYEYFLSVVVPRIESRVVDFLVLQELEGLVVPALSQLIDENGQVNLNVASMPETFVTLKAEYPQPTDLVLQTTPIVSFISFSIPFYDSKDPQTRKRLGVLQVSMLEHPKNSEQDTGSIFYDVGIQIWPYTSFSKPVSVT